MKLFKLKALLLLAIGLLLTNQSKGEDEAYFFDSSGQDVVITYADWTTNAAPLEPLYTKETFAGSIWETYAFTKDYPNSVPSTGYEEFPLTATIFNTNALDKKYKRAAVHVTFQNAAWRDEYEYSVYLQVASDKEMTNPTKYEATRMISVMGKYFIFDIPEEVESDYYKFCFEVPEGGPKDRWLRASEIFFYTNVEDLVINFNEEDKYCSFLSKRGELHLTATEYDESDNEIGHPQLIPVKEESWTNKVADQGETYVVQAPGVPGHYYDIRVKSVFNGEHSPEKQITLTQDGFTTGSGSIKNELNSVERACEYFDLAGRKISGQARGFIIKKQGNKTEKLFIP